MLLPAPEKGIVKGKRTCKICTLHCDISLRESKVPIQKGLDVFFADVRSRLWVCSSSEESF